MKTFLTNFALVFYRLYVISFLIFVFIGTSASVNAQDFRVLVFHKTNGFRHTGAINEGNKMIKALGETHGWNVDDTQDSEVFNIQNLSRYKVVIWNNATGNNLLNASQQQAFESYIRSGGGFVGIHAATDTYRDRSWPWYNDLVGAIVQTNPNHSPNNTTATMDLVESEHPIVSHLGATWTKSEEWFYWEKNGGYLFSGNKVLLRVRSTGSNSYDAARPVTWYKEYDGGRSFYTALGHNGSDYVANSNFGKLIANAVIWVANSASTNIFDIVEDNFRIYPNPASALINVNLGGQQAKATLYDMTGIKRMDANAINGTIRLPVDGLPRGLYMLKIEGERVRKTERIILK